MNNYEFCAHWITEQSQAPGVRVLDYGCGAGQIVRELRMRNVDALGCDVFYEGADYSHLADQDVLESNFLKRMVGGVIPFDDRSFDFVVNNQVMEHVDDIDAVLSEIRRVLKPGGSVLSLFPDKGVWREGHCGIPFLHWFPKGSRARVYYAAALRALGLGYNKKGKGILLWSEEYCEWLDKWTIYRPRDSIYASYGKSFRELAHIEDYWFQQRLGPRRWIVSWMPSSVQKLIVRKLGGLVFVARDPL